jgi:antitoxin ParD1/3/4
MPTMNVSLPDDLNEFVADQLANGGYNNQSEVVRDALRLLRVRSEARRELNERLDRGIADADRRPDEALHPRAARKRCKAKQRAQAETQSGRRLKRHAIQISDDAKHNLDDIADWYTDHHPGGQDRFLKDFTACP